MSDNMSEKLPNSVIGILIFMFSILIALAVYWWLHTSGTVAFV